MAKESNTFYATVQKVTTLADGGLRATFDLPEDAVYTAAWLMEMKRLGTVLDVKTVVRDGNSPVGAQAERE